MEDWVVSIYHWGNGYCEWQAKSPEGDVVFSRSLDDLFVKVKERVNE